MSEADEPQSKKAKISDEGMSIEKWIPKSISEIKDKFAFDSTTYHSPIPDAVANNPREQVSLGVDEAGRGPVLGPMVYGISYCLESYQEGLKKKYGFADSKTLKDSRRQELFQLIDQEDHELHRNVGWATCTMTAKDISSGMLRSALGQGAYNLNEQAHDTTIALISEVIKSGVNVRKIFVDTVGPPAAYQAKLQRVFSGVDVTVTKKADSIYPIVSTASVVAKVTRDLNLQFYEKNLEVVKGQSLGSGYPSDPTTSRWLKENVDPVFGWHHGLVRFSWQTAKDALEKAGAAKVIYEEECVKDKGYKDVTEMFNEPDCLIDQSYYAKPVVL
ncbi:ribonuclease HII [Candidozyma auris]|nr:ribonuclease HII [[Candida] auris]